MPQLAPEPAAPLALPGPAVVCVAPNGARRTAVDHPALPVEPDAIARDALACADAGATVIHLHVRDAAGGHSLDVERYRAAMQAIDRTVGPRLLVQITTEAVGRYEPQAQIDTVTALRPQAASVALRELMPDDSDAALARAADFFAWAEREAVALQFIVYAPDEAARLRALVARGVVAQRTPHALFVLGRYTAGQQSDPLALLPFLADWPSAWPWSVCAFGRMESRCVAAAIALGGHARVGFENNLLRPDGQPASGNAELVALAARVAVATGRGVASVQEARRVYGARPQPDGPAAR